MRSEERLAEALHRSTPTPDVDAIFERISARKVRRRRVRTARVPAVLGMAVAVVAGAVALSSPGQPSIVAANRPDQTPQVADDIASGNQPAAPSDEPAAPESQSEAAPAESRAKPSKTARPAAAPRAGTAALAAAAGGDGVRSPGPDHVSAVEFPDPQHGWALIGMNGDLFATSDGGRTWVGQATGYDGELLALNFVDPLRGWIVGRYAVLRTVDGGQTWMRQPTPELKREDGSLIGLTDVAFVDGRQGWVVGNCGVIMSTADGGESWGLQRGPDCSGPNLRRVFFADAERGWAVSAMEGPLFATRDGGKTWNEQPAAPLTDVFFADASHGWAVGPDSTVLSTSDGGATWVRRTLPIAASLNAVFFADTLHGWAVGITGDPEQAAVVATVDGGQTWTAQSAPGRNLVGGVAFTSSVAWAYGDGVVRTTDSGATWSATSPG